MQPLYPPPSETATHERFWNWIFRENDGPNHPLKISNGGQAQERFGNVLMVAGSLQGEGRKDRSLRISADIGYIFVPADIVLCTEADGDGPTDQDLINNVNNDIRGAAGIAGVSVNGNHQTVDLLSPHLFSLDIQKAISGTGRSRRGEGISQGRQLPLQTRAATAGYHVFICVNNLKTENRIEIRGRNINVTYTVR